MDTLVSDVGTDEIDIAQTGPGTLGGRFLRRFWTPVYRGEALEKGHAKPIRIMCEDFTLYRAESGKPYIVESACPHRNAPMHLGWVEGEAIRCIYHGWKFDCTGQCVEQPAEGEGFARKVKIRSVPAREHLGLVFGYFGEGEPPAFPPYPAPEGEGILETPHVPPLPCNYLQSFENSLDEVHVSFVHRPGGSHSGMYEIPEMGAEETPWGVLRRSRRKNGEVRLSLHYMPTCTRVIVPPMAGYDGVGGWKELYLNFTPIDDENQVWFPVNLVRVSGEAAAAYLAKDREYHAKVAAVEPARDVALRVLRGEMRLHDVKHPDLVRVQDAAVQVGQGKVENRARERLGKSDVGIILWRKILERELRAMRDGRPLKQWTSAPESLLPTLGF